MKTRILILSIMAFLCFSQSIIAQEGCAHCKYFFRNIPSKSCPPKEPYVLIFSDEFDGDKVDDSKWRKGRTSAYPDMDEEHIGLARPGVWCDGYCDLWEVSNGTLKMKLIKRDFEQKDDDGNIIRVYPYVTGHLLSQQRFGYGKFEIKCKVPKGRSLWPAYWLYGTTKSEIDLFEFFNLDDPEDADYIIKNPQLNVHQDIIGDGKEKFQCYKRVDGDDFDTKFNTFSVERDPYEVVFSIEGQQRYDVPKYVGTLNCKNAILCEDLTSEFTQVRETKAFPTAPTLQMEANVALHRGHDPLNVDLPAVMEIDYIRHWVRGSCEDRVFSNTAQLNLSTKDFYDTPDFNYKIGKTITMQSAVEIPAEVFFLAVADEKIVLKQGFKASAKYTWGPDDSPHPGNAPNVKFIAKIDNTCDGGNMVALAPKDESLESLKNDKLANTMTSNEDQEGNKATSSLEHFPEGFKIYPNPTDGIFKLQFDVKPTERTKFHVQNAAGLHLFSGKLETITKIDMSQYSRGVYYLTLRLENGTSTYKIVVE